MTWDWEKLKQQQDNKKVGGKNSPPQVDEFVNQIKKIKFPGFALAIIILIVIFFGTSTFFTVKIDEVGIVQRFGKYVRQADPGLHFKLPAGIEKVTKVKVAKVFQEKFGPNAATPITRASFLTEENNITLMLTGDLNVAIVPWIVLYKIKNPYNYLFKVNNPEKMLKDMSEASMRAVVGDSSINEVITKREQIADEAKVILQEELDKAGTGIQIDNIEMKKTNVPGPVQSSFNEVNQATQEKEKMVYQAKEQYNKAIPAAKGIAARSIKEAEGYALDRINRAKGDAARFSDVYAEYKKAKDVTKRRLYFEMVKKLYPKLTQKYIISANQNNLLPLLNIGKQNGVIK